MNARIGIAFLMVLLMVLPVALPVSTAQAQEKGPAADRIIWTRVPLEGVTQAFQNGEIDVYLFGLDPDVAQELSQIPGIKLYTAPAGLNDFGLNPAPVQIVTVNQEFASKEEAAQFFGVDPVVIRYVESANGTSTVEFCAKQTNLPAGVNVEFESDKMELNPFCFRDIRFALNYVVDRERIVNEVYKTFAIPKYTFYGPDDPVYTELIDVVAKFRFTYQPQLAKNIVTDVMTRAGAELREDTWYYNGKPVSIIGIIRVEDQRYQLGHIFANELEALGFNVQRQELTFFEAILKVYFTNPIDFEWGFYTEGWGKGAIDKWDAGNLAQFGATWLGWAPGWGESTYWNYKPEVVDENGKTVDFYSKATFLMQNITSKEQWIEYLRKGTELGTLEAIRIWVVATLDAFAAVDRLQGVTVDMGAGLRSLYNCRGWNLQGAEEQTIRVGHLWAWTSRSVYNVLGGFDDVYSVDVARCTFDPFSWFHPFNGRPIPFRVSWEVTTAGPDGTLQVPDDAIFWDAENDRWAPITEFQGRDTATSKVVLDLSKFIGSKWHSGNPITWADIMAYYAVLLDTVYDAQKSSLESSIANTLKPSYDTFVAFRPLVDENKLEVYVNYWHFDENYIGANAILATVELPAELILFHDYVAYVTQERALSDTRSQSVGIPQLSLVLPEDAQLVKQEFQGDFAAMYDEYKSYFTLPGVGVLMTQDEWQQRLANDVAYIDEYGVAWISQGPWKIVYFNKDAQRIELEAFRDPTYPFGPNDWVFGEPQPTKITNVLTPIVAPGERAQIVVTAVGKPPVHVKYLLRDPITGNIITSGEAVQTPQAFIIELPPELTDRLAEYSVYELVVIAYSEEIALPDERVVALQTTQSIGKALQPIEEQIGQLQEQTQQQLQQIQEQTQQQLQQIQEQFQQQLQQLQQALGGQLGQALEGLSQSVQQLGTSLQDALTQSITQLNNALTDSISQLNNALGAQVADLSTAVSDLNNNVQQLNQQVQQLSDTVQQTQEAAQQAQSAARNAMILGILNLIILLGLAAMLLRGGKA